MTFKHPSDLSRRELLLRSGMGLGALGLAGLLFEEGSLCRGGQSAGAAAAALSRQGEARDSFLSATAGRRTSTRSTPSRPWRSTPASRCRRRCAPNARPGRPSRRRSSSRRYGQSGIEVSELFAQDGRAHRRHRRHPLDVGPGAEPRAVADADELRRLGAAAAERRRVGAVRPGDREPEPARLHRHVPRRLPDQGRRELAVGLSARRVPGDVHRFAARAVRQADREHRAPARHARRPSGGSSTCWRS